MSAETFVDSNLWLYAYFLRPGEEERHERARFCRVRRAHHRMFVGAHGAPYSSTRLHDAWEGAAGFG